MTTPVNCPNCGSTLAPGAPNCARCGKEFPEDPVTEAGPPAAPQGAPATPQFARPAPEPLTPTRTSIDIKAEIERAKERWDVTQSPYLIALAVVGLVAILVGSLAHTMFLLADDFKGQSDSIAWFTLARGAAIATVAVAVLVRWQNPSRSGAHRDDLRIVGVIGGLAGLWMLVGLFLGFDDRLVPEESWYRYAEIFALVAAGYAAISRPFDEMIGSVHTLQIAIGGGIFTAIVFLIGLFMAMSDDASTYSQGVTLQDLGQVLAVLLLALFLGLKPKPERMY